MENFTQVTIFTFSGLNESRTNKNIYFAFTLFLYLLTVVVNLTVIATIIIEKTLHEPMYILLCNLCVNGLYGTAGFYPKLLDDFLSDSHVISISYTGCLTQAFVIYSHALCEITILTVMAYDRYVAICRPLQYHSVMTPLTVGKLLLFAWGYPFCSRVITIYLILRLPLCGSHIEKLYCDNSSVLKLSCLATTLSSAYGYIIIIAQLAQATFIIYTYIQIVRACLKSIEQRSKFMQTCLPHLMALISFIIAALIDMLYSRYSTETLSPSLRNIMAVEYLVIPPLFNPLVYGLKLHQIRSRVFRACARDKVTRM
ncbi:olfactory receptor 8I2-like [Amia ocellicauda]|uniref:olfactory receptor 8I2-like n=1 Tax=Amia ocellicauda TaxID=2972642 RepID=UPI003464696E|nr:O52R1 protein [Amia calva]